ncbi:MAG: alpha/beta hydrolase [Betaproteobacteria bacterium]|nr:alpha/beta hydrolase [Betaproteobacteria bacterium]
MSQDNRRPAIRPDWEPPIPGRRHVLNTWDEYLEMATRIVGRFHSLFTLRYFEYVHPTRLQQVSRRFRKPYNVRVAYTDWGAPGLPTLVCCGGVANSAMRFNYLAADLHGPFRVVCMDWVGRGLSGWMADERDYSLATYVEQLRQLIMHLGTGPVIVLGSSLGGSAAIELAARHPRLVSRLILNDIGPFIPSKRRKRRSETLARHYVFRHPADLLRRVGASQKNDGPISDDIRFNITFHQTRWSDEDGGRVYRHDVRALQAYRRDAQLSLRQWELWAMIRCPIMLIHGMLSDALLPHTIARMKQTKTLTVMHVPDTGHTPVLSDRNQTWLVLQWLLHGGRTAEEWSVLHHPLRENAEEPASVPVQSSKSQEQGTQEPGRDREPEPHAPPASSLRRPVSRIPG